MCATSECWPERYKTADFREQRSLENFDFGSNPAINRTQIYELAACHFVRQHPDVLLVGPPSVGKSHLVQAIGPQALKCALFVLDRSIFDLVSELLTQGPLGGEGSSAQQIPQARPAHDPLMLSSTLIEELKYGPENPSPKEWRNPPEVHHAPL